METLYEEFGGVANGFVVIQLIGADYDGLYPDVADLQNWIADLESSYGITVNYVVAADPYFAIGDIYNQTGYIPYYWLVDQDLVIDFKSSWQGLFHSRIDNLLNP